MLQVEIESIMKEMKFNEIEIAYWSLWLDNFHWEDPLLNCKKFLWVTAFQTKVFKRIIYSVF